VAGCAGDRPLMLDAYQLQIEHNLLSETLFEALILAGVVVLLWNRRPSLRALASRLPARRRGQRPRGRTPAGRAGGALRRAGESGGWRRVGRAAVLTTAFALPVLGYGAYFSAVAGKIGLTTRTRA